MAGEGFKRKLTAILSADVIGYSRLMRDDEEATVRDLAAHRVLISNIIQQNHGRVVDSPGDNILAEFASVVDAVNGAIKIQDEIKKSNADIPDDRRMEFRIGINLGDVIEEEERIYGDGVNIAARVEGLAAGGGIAISGIVYDSIKDKLSLGYHNLGEQQVKNIPEPVRVYRLLTEPADAGKLIDEEKTKSNKLLWAAAAAILLIILGLCTITIKNYYFRPSFEPASVEKMAFPLPEKPSIAVLPFDNMSGDPEQDYLSDGLTEQLISALSKVEYLFVIARNSTFTYKGKPAKVKQVAEELGVRYVLEGSVQKVEDRLRITVQLIDALKGHHLWSESYDRELKDIFDLQDEITMKVVTAMRVKLTAGEEARAFGKGTKNLKAYLKRLEAFEPYYMLKKEANVRAKKLLEEAILLDPEFADAYSLLAYCHINDALYGWSKSPPKSMHRAFELAQKAQSLDSSLPQPHGIKGIIYVFQKKYEEAIVEAQQAVEIYPHGPMQIFTLGWILRLAGRPEEAIPLMEKSIRLNPIPTYMAFDTLGRAYFLAGKYEKAIGAYKTAVKVDPDLWDAHVGLAATYAVLGREDEARTEVSEILRIEPSFSIKKYEKFMSYQLGLEPEIEGLRKAGLPEHPPLKLPDKPSIAVLPFDNLSKDPEQEYFADGMTDDLITDLSKISSLFIIARNSVFQYKGKAIDVKKISRELGVRYVLEGSVRRYEDKMRINAQLIDATTGGHLWAERYDGKMDDVFALQDKITQKIVTALAVKLTVGEKGQVTRKETDKIEAYDNFLQGWVHYVRCTPEDYVKAVQYFEKAIETDPDYGRVYAALASIYWESHYRFWHANLNVSWDEARGRAERYLQKAMDNPTPLAYHVTSKLLIGWHRYEEAISNAEHAMALDPNDADSYIAMAYALIYSGKPQEAINFVERAMRIDPKYPAYYLFVLGLAHFSLEQLNKSAVLFERALKRNPENYLPLIPLAAIYAHLGREEKANSVIAELKRLLPILTISFVKQCPLWQYKNPQDRNRLLNGLVKAGLAKSHYDLLG
jgi:adenylate cyclase